MPNERALTEKMLGLLGEAGLPDPEVTLAYHALIEYVVGSAVIDIADANDAPADVEAEAPPLARRLLRGVAAGVPAHHPPGGAALPEP